MGSVGTVFLAQGTASAKALKQERAWWVEKSKARVEETVSEGGTKKQSQGNDRGHIV